MGSIGTALVMCQDCQHVLLDPLNPIQGGCECRLIEQYREKIKDLPKHQATRLLEQAMAKVGRWNLKVKQQPFDYPNVLRMCDRFINKTPVNSSPASGVSKTTGAL